MTVIGIFCFLYCTFVHVSVLKSPVTNQTGFTGFGLRFLDTAKCKQKKSINIGHMRRINRKYGLIVLHSRKQRLNAGQARLPDASTGPFLAITCSRRPTCTSGRAENRIQTDDDDDNDSFFYFYFYYFYLSVFLLRTNFYIPIPAIITSLRLRHRTTIVVSADSTSFFFRRQQQT